MTWPCFELLALTAEINPPGELIEEAPLERCPDATQRTYAVDQGRIILIEWRGRLHEVIYQTPVEDQFTRKSRMTLLFDHYGEGQPWREILDNGWGKSYRRTDQQRFALWSYSRDYQTFGPWNITITKSRQDITPPSAAIDRLSRYSLPIQKRHQVAHMQSNPYEA